MPKQEPVSRYETFEPGTYKETYIEFFSKDSSGLPVYVVQEGRGGIRMVARYRTYNDEDKEGPPGSIEEGELPLLVHAFGGDVTQLPDDKLKALSVAEQLIKASDKEVMVTVGDSGWIRKVYDMDLPVNDYVFKGIGLPRIDEDGEHIFTKTGFGKFAVSRLVVDDPNSPFNGVPYDVWINWEPFIILKAVAPDAYSALLGEDELKHLDEMIKSHTHRIHGSVELDDKGRARLNKSSLRPVTEDEVADKTGEPSLGPIEHLYQAIADAIDKKAWRESAAFAGVGTLSQTGKVWAKEHMASICKKEGIPKNFDQMTEDNIRTILEKLERNDLAELMGSEEPW